MRVVHLRSLVATLAATACLSAAAVQPANATTPFPYVLVDESTIEHTAASGYRNGQGSVVRQPGRDAILTGIGVDEQGGGNAPCYVKPTFSRRTSVESRIFSTRWWQDPCDRDQSGSYESVGLWGNQFSGIAAISVCTNDRDNQRLKGVRIETIRGFSSNGELYDLPQTGSDPVFAAPNCSQWHRKVTCSAGKFAVGLEIFADGDGVSGLALVCAAASIEKGGPDSNPPIPEFSLDDIHPVTTSVSGIIGNNLRLGPGDDSDEAIIGIETGERTNHPCIIRAYSAPIRTLITGDGWLLGHHIRNRCGNEQDLNALSVGVNYDPAFIDAHGIDLSSLVLSGIRVCMNGAGTRVKGLELEGRQILVSGDNIIVRDMQLHETDKIDELPNCANDGWRRWVRCQSGMVATALVPHFQPGPEPKAMTGMALECRRVVMRA